MLDAFSIEELEVNGMAWYLTALLVAGFVIYFFLTYCETLYLNFIAPIGVLLIYFYYYRTVGHIGISGLIKQDGILCIGFLLRAFAGLSLGAIGYYIVKKWEFYQINKWIWVPIEVLLMLFVIISSAYGGSRLDYFYILCMFIAIIISFRNDQPLLVMNNRITANFGRITYAIYLNHNLLRIVFGRILKLPYDLKTMAIYVMTLILYSFLTNWFVNTIIKTVFQNFFIVFSNKRKN